MQLAIAVIFPIPVFLFAPQNHTANIRMANPAQKHILCIWEIGGDLGHLTRLANITRKLEQMNHRVTVAVKDLSRALPVFRDTGATLLQAPVWLPKISLNRPIACMADTLLLLGYLEPDGLQSLYRAWQGLTRLLQPDLIVYDYAPTALLANQHSGIPAITVGTGFMDPAPDQPLADWRPRPYQDQLVARQEARLLDTINQVLQREGQPSLARFSDLYRNSQPLITTFPPLDLYQGQRAGALYRPCSRNSATRQPVRFPDGDGPRIIAYLKPHYQHLDLLLKALSLSRARVFVACPGGREEQFRPYAYARFHYSTQLVELETGIAQADLFLGHGNMGTVVQALESATPTVVIPLHLEQLLTGQRLQQAGAGVLIEQIESAEHLRDQLESALSSTALQRQTQQFRDQHRPLLEEDLADAVARLCDALLPQAQAGAG